MQPLRVGRYVVHDAIAAGGMATVHYGRLLGEVGFSRTVAIKRLHDAFATDPDFIAMFIDEARLAARIRHPNVVTTLDVVSQEGALILVMEYLHGETLSKLLRAASRDGERVHLDVASGVVCDALHGLHAAHEATSEAGAPLHLVHRDVSPQNLLVGAEGITRVVDFGVAKAIGQSHVTREGQLKGKLAYMAPEQILGEAVDRRADVYATGVVLWELLTQQPLFASQSDGATMQRALSYQAPPPSSIAPDVPLALDQVVLRALARDPSHRFATARDMAQALEAAAPVASARRIGEWVDALAGDRLAARKRRLAEIEFVSSGNPEGGFPEPLRSSSVGNPEGGFPEPLPFSVVAATKVEPSGAPDPPSPRRWPIAAAATALVLAAVGVVGVALAAKTTSASAQGQPEKEAAPAAAVPVTSVPSVPSVASVASASAGPSPSASPDPAAPRSVVAAGHRGATRKVDPATSSPSSRAPCPVRSFVDADGITQFRRDCGK